MRKRLNLPMLALVASLGACAPEATAPEGGAGISRVVPLAVPDVWCPAPGAGPDTTDAKRPRVRCDAPKQSPAATDSMVVVDSASNQ
jgi:hypothetical protein